MYGLSETKQQKKVIRRRDMFKCMAFYANTFVVKVKRERVQSQGHRYTDRTFLFSAIELYELVCCNVISTWKWIRNSGVVQVIIIVICGCSFFFHFT